MMIEPKNPSNEKERLRYLQQLNILDSAIEERFERITRMVCASLDVPISAVSLVDSNRQWFKSIQGLDVEETPREIAFCAHAILDNKPFVIEDATRDPRFVGNPLVTSDPSIRFYAGHPLVMENGLHLGTLCAIDKKPRHLTEDELAFLADLAQMVQVELHALYLTNANQQLATELKAAERAALIDPLTRIWNRGGGNKHLETCWSKSLEKQTPFSIAMMDLDHFKAINDTHGHDVGDATIRQVTKSMLSALRPDDLIARWGGEEFLIIFGDCGPAHLPPLLERLIKCIRSTTIQTPGGPISITASLGAASIIASPSTTPAELIKAADTALYAAKQGGRDRFIVSQHLHAQPSAIIVKA